MATDDRSNYEIFRDCFSDALLQRITTTEAKSQAKKKGRSRRKSSISAPAKNEASTDSSSATTIADAEELAEFIEYLASEAFPSLPTDLQTLSYTAVQASPELASTYAASSIYAGSELSEALLAPIPPSVPDSLEAYSILSAENAFVPLMSAALADYIEAATAAPPVWVSTRASECEICGRDWVPLSYHHLIPKSTHERVRKRGWHEEWRLNSVAWLCRACHSFVHRCESNETLARSFFTVELLLEREDVVDWAKWVGRVRWKAK